MMKFISRTHTVVEDKGTIYSMIINPTKTSDELHMWVGQEVEITNCHGHIQTGIVLGIEMFLIGGDYPHSDIGILI